MEVELRGKVLSTQISEMSGFKFGTIIIETIPRNTRFTLKYDRKSKGPLPSVGDIVTLAFEGTSSKRIAWIKIGIEEEKKELEPSKSTIEQPQPSMSDIFMAATADLTRQISSMSEQDPIVGKLASLASADRNSTELHQELKAARASLLDEPTSMELWKKLLGLYQKLRRPEAEWIELLLGNQEASKEDYLLLLSRLLIGGAKYDSAISVLSNLEETSPDDSRVLLLRGRSHIIYGEYEEALDKLQKAIDINGNDIEALWDLSRVYGFLGKKDEALEHLDKILKIDSNNKNALILKHILETHGAGQTLSFGIFAQKPGPGSSDERSVDEIRFHFGLEMPVGSTIEEILHVIFRMDYEKGFKNKYHKSVLLMIFHDSESMRYNCDAHERKIMNTPFLFTEYRIAEPYSYSASTHNPYRLDASLSDVIMPDALISFFRTTMSLKVATIVMWYEKLKDEIEERLRRVALSEK
ncbi:MAG: tetratricopeptide repeat protein [Candidatus Thorarchaeota archaeon]|nr:tetratricopeptide repeat protein [Candidatus Thorarchaeota archaeon]